MYVRRVHHGMNRLLRSLMNDFVAHAASVQTNTIQKLMSCAHTAVASMLTSIISNGDGGGNTEHWRGFVTCVNAEAHEVVREPCYAWTR